MGALNEPTNVLTGGRTSPEALDIGIVAGEASGDLLGSHLIHALKARWPNARFRGIVGAKMQAAGAVSLFPMERLAVRGYVEVLRHFRPILKIRQALVREFLKYPPDLFIGIDAPDFNHGLERRLKRRGIPTVHYVSPSIWAWRGERIKKIAHCVDHMLLLFPFEQAIYDKAGIGATYVGHPLGDLLPFVPDHALARAQLKIEPGVPVIALLPGSRQSELDYLGELFIRTAAAIHAVRPDIRFLVPLVSHGTRNFFLDVLYRLGLQDLPLTVLFGHAHSAMTAADAVLVASGTATLEAALLKRPMVVAYRVSRLTWKLAKRKAYLPYLGLPNILAGRFVVPEFLQEDATPENLAQAVLNVMDSEPIRRAQVRQFEELHRSLRQDAPARLSDAILPFLGRSRRH
ncbi:MAG: lipid-A-disaccharide synthase [Betaproteobacteria bacterium]|nr:lipid-A-disaccharide synthase [Betaproteobacteria bacterium]